MTEATPARFDHIVVAVKDLNKAITTYRNGLGFTVVPGGEHPAGTHNALVHFGLSYVELLADPDHRLAEDYGVWVLRERDGRQFMGIERSTFIIGPDGTISHVFRRVTPAGHAKELLAALGQ